MYQGTSGSLAALQVKAWLLATRGRGVALAGCSTHAILGRYKPLYRVSCPYPDRHWHVPRVHDFRHTFAQQTAEILGALLAERSDRPLPNDPLFRNSRGARITRFGVRYILKKHCARARPLTPTLAAKRLHPHSMRHSTAVTSAASGRRHRHYQPMAWPCQCHNDQPLRHHRS